MMKPISSLEKVRLKMLNNYRIIRQRELEEHYSPRSSPFFQSVVPSTPANTPNKPDEQARVEEVHSNITLVAKLNVDLTPKQADKTGT